MATIEAPAGFGKTTLLRQIVGDAPDASALVTDPAGLKAALQLLKTAQPDSVLVALDEASERLGEVRELVEHGSLRTLVLADRHLSADLLAVTEEYEGRQWTAHDLRFTEDEMHQLAELLAGAAGAHPPTDGPPDLAKRVAYILGPASEGWPLAANWMLHRAFASGDPLRIATDLSYPGPDSDAFVDEQLANLAPDLRDALLDLSHFDAFTGSCVDTLVGPDGAGRARSAGAALLSGERGWYRLARPVARPLKARRDLPRETARLLAPVLIASGGTLAGLRALWQAGCVEDLDRTLRTLRRERLDEVDQQGLADVVATTRAHRDAPHLALIEARAHRNLGNHQASDACLDACLDLATPDWLSDPLNAEHILGEQIDRLFSRAFEPSDQIDRELAELRSQVQSHMSKKLGLRLDEIDALLRGQSADPLIVDQAVNDVFSVAKRWENLAEKKRAVQAIRHVCGSAVLHLGRYRDGIQALEHAAAIADVLRDRALNLALSCRVRAIAGEIDDIDPFISESWALVDAIDHSWVRGYMHWSEAIVAARRHDPKTLLEKLALAESPMGGLLEHATGIVFHSEAAMSCAEVGMLDEADRHLSLVAHRASYEHVDYGLAAATVAARRGDRDKAADVLSQLVAGGRLPAGRAWRGTFEESIAADLAGDGESATRLRSSALAAASKHGQARLAALLLQRAPSNRPAEATESTLEIGVLGGFSVIVDGEPVDVPDGRVSRLLKLLSVNDGAVPVEVVYDALWPDVDVAVARRRIKNVISRLRTLVGPDHVIRTNEALELGPAVLVDLRVFSAHVGSALRGAPDVDTAVPHLKAALEVYRGPVLPTDLYDDWAAEARHSAAARALAVLDQVFDLDPPHRPVAAWLFDVLLRLDRDDDSRLLRITRQALAEGHEACARAALERALAVAQDLGVTLEDEVRDLRFLLKTA